MKITVKIEGKLFEKGIIDKEVIEPARKEVMRFGGQKVKDNTPVRTGRLRRGWQTKRYEISNEVEYAPYLEDGTTRMAPRRIAGRTAEVMQKYAEKEVRDRIGNLG